MQRISGLLPLVCLSVLALAAAPPSHAQPEPGAIVLNELLYAPDPSTNEFIELLNRSDQTVDLSQCTYADGNLDFDPVATAETLLAPGGYAVLARDLEAFAAAFPGVEALASPGWEALNNGGDRVEVRCQGTTIDAVEYDDSWGGSDGASLERIDPAGPSNDASNFATSTAERGATPGAPNSRFAVDDTPPALVRAFAAPTADTVVAVFSEPVDPATVSADRFRLAPASAPALRTAMVDASDPSQVRCVLASALPTGTFTLVAMDVADRRGNVLGEGRVSFDVVAPDRPAPQDLVLNEILYDPPGLSGEYVELLNRSDKTFDLRQFTVSDNRGRPAPLVETPRVVPPGAFVVLVEDRLAFQAAFPGVDAVEVDAWPALNNGGDTPTLRAGDMVIDAVPYTPSWGGQDASLERIDPAGPSSSPTNFATTTAARGGTPGAQNSQFAPDTTPPALIFAEQVGPSRAEAAFDEPLAPATVRPDAFSLGGAGPATATLRTDRVVRLMFSAPIEGGTLTAEGVADLTGNVQPQATAPLALQPTPGDLAVNEILFDPLADAFDARPDQAEYVELVNRTTTRLTLHNGFLTDRPTETGASDTTRLAQRTALPPEGFAVVFAAPDAPTDSAAVATLTRAFPDVPRQNASAVFLPIDANTLNLNNDGDDVRVHRADGALLDTVRYDPDWHAEALAETKGTSLERISPTGPPQSADNWTSSAAPSGGTPGQPNAVGIPPGPDPSTEPLTVSPSPFSISRDGGTRIRFSVDAVPSTVRVRIYDAQGRLVRTLEDARLTGRTGELVWNGRGDRGEPVRMGIYVVHLEAVSAETGSVTVMQAPVVLARSLN